MCGASGQLKGDVLIDELKAQNGGCRTGNSDRGAPAILGKYGVVHDLGNFALGLGPDVKFEERRPALNPLTKIGFRKLPFENHAGVVCIRPAKPAFQRRKVGQSQDDVPELADGGDGSEPRAAFGNVLDVARILPFPDDNPGAALDGIARMATALTNWLRLKRVRNQHRMLRDQRWHG